MWPRRLMRSVDGLLPVPPSGSLRARWWVVLWEGWSMQGAPTPALLFGSGMCFSSGSPHCPSFACLGSCHWIFLMHNLFYFCMHLSLKKCSKISSTRLWPLMGVQFMGADYKLFRNNPFIFSHSSSTLTECHRLLILGIKSSMLQISFLIQV